MNIMDIVSIDFFGGISIHKKYYDIWGSIQKGYIVN